MLVVDGLSWGVGYGEAEDGSTDNTQNTKGDDEHMTGFINYSMGPVTLGYQESRGSVAEMVMPGDRIKMTAELINPIAIEQGMRFAVREGGRTVGAGVVSKIID